MSTSQFTSLVGTALDNGNLLFVDILGSGHSGVVYRAVDLSTPKPHAEYAVKCLSNVQHSAQRDNEINLHCAVAAHPNVLSIYRVIETEEFVLLVMELCTGGDLWTAVTERHVFWQNDELVRSAFMQLVDAIEYCHGLGVYHRDIKLENVLCSKDGSKVLLADFGLATTDPVSFQFGVGTQYYISPESIAGQEHAAGPYSPAQNDVWSLGVVMLNMLTGLCAWSTASMNDDHFRRYLDPNSNHLRSMLPISREADVLLRRALCVNPWRRISLAQLKKDIMGVKTFFMTDVEIALAPHRVAQSAAAQQTPWVPQPAEREVEVQRDEVKEDSHSSGSLYSQSSRGTGSQVIPGTPLFTASSRGTTVDSRDVPATPVLADTPPACVAAEQLLDDDVEQRIARPALGVRRSTKSIKQGASKRFQAVMTKLRAF